MKKLNKKLCNKRRVIQIKIKKQNNKNNNFFRFFNKLMVFCLL